MVRRIGTVSRGVCEIENGILKSVTEHTALDKNSGIPLDTLVSMNMWGLGTDFFPYLEKEVSYITVILSHSYGVPDEEGAMRNYNIRAVTKQIPEDNILYVADSVPALVLRVTPEDRNALRKIDDIVFIGDAFFTSKMGGSGLAESGVYTLGNVTGRQDEYYEGEQIGEVKFVNAADARLVLRFAAGLEKPETELKRFYYCADMNFDGEINSADARLCLRTAAGLEKEYDLTFGYKSSWYDLMG